MIVNIVVYFTDFSITYGREATGITRDLDEIINELDQEHQMAPIQIELVENELAIVYMNSKKGEVRYL